MSPTIFAVFNQVDRHNDGRVTVQPTSYVINRSQVPTIGDAINHYGVDGRYIVTDVSDGPGSYDVTIELYPAWCTRTD